MVNNSVKLVICSPILHMDEFPVRLAAGLIKLKEAGLEFTHIVVGPERNREAVADVFRDTNSMFLAEEKGTKGIFHAVAQGYDLAVETLSPTHLAWINSDDLLEPGFLRAVERCVVGEPQLITGHVNWINDKGGLSGRIPTWPVDPLLVELFEAGIPAFTQQGTILSVDVWKKAGGFDLSYKFIADTVLWHRLLKEKIARRVFVPHLVASYMIRPGQLSGDRTAVGAERERWRRTFNHGIWQKTKRAAATLLMRVYNSPIYLRRLLSGQKMRADSAMREGGF